MQLHPQSTPLRRHATHWLGLAVALSLSTLNAAAASPDSPATSTGMSLVETGRAVGELSKLCPTAWQLIEQGWRTSPQYALYLASLRSALATEKATNRGKPVVSFKASQRYESPLATSLQVQVPLDLTGSEALKVEQAHAIRLAAEASAEEIRITYVHDSLAQLADLRYQLRQVERLDRLAALFSETSDIVSLLAMEGLQSGADVSSFELRRQAVTRAAAQARAQASRGLTLASKKFGISPEAATEFAEAPGDVFERDLTETLGKLSTETLVRRVDVQVAAQAVRRDIAAEKLLELSKYPTFRLDSLIGLAGQSLAHLLNPLNLLKLVTASVDWTVFDAGLQASIREAAQATGAKSVAQYSDTLRQASAEVAAAYVYLVQSEKLRQLAKEAVAKQEVAYRRSSESFALQAIDRQALLTAQQAMSESISQLIDAERDYNTSAIALLRALGLT